MCPVRRVGAAVAMPKANTKALEAHLAEIGRRVRPGAHAVVVLDGAGCTPRPGCAPPKTSASCRCPRLRRSLRGSAPKPVESIWECRRQNWLSHRVWESYEAIVHACCDAWNALVQVPDRIASITARSRAKVTT